MLKKEPRPVLAAIGPITARKLEDAGLAAGILCRPIIPVPALVAAISGIIFRIRGSEMLKLGILASGNGTNAAGDNGQGPGWPDRGGNLPGLLHNPNAGVLERAQKPA